MIKEKEGLLPERGGKKKTSAATRERRGETTPFNLSINKHSREMRGFA